MDTLTEILNSIFVANKEKNVPNDTLKVKLNKYKHIEVQTEIMEPEAIEVVPETEVVEAEVVPEVVEAATLVPEAVEDVVVVEAEPEQEPEAVEDVVVVEAEPEQVPEDVVVVEGVPEEVEDEVVPEAVEGVPEQEATVAKAEPEATVAKAEPEATVAKAVPEVALKERNVLIVNNSLEENMVSLVNILSSVDTATFENELNIITSSDKKPRFKKMLIEHPELYFINLNFKSNKKEGVFIVDFDHLVDIEKLTPFLSDDIYLIVLSTEYSSYIAGLYNLMNDFKRSTIVHTKDATKVLQKKFYTKIIKNTIVEELTLDDYLQQINQSSTVIVKSGRVEL
jgi:hypothetical protein